MSSTSAFLSMLSGLFDSLIDGLGNLVGFVFITAVGAVVQGARKLYQHDNRLDDVEEELETNSDGKTRLEKHEEWMEELQAIQKEQSRYLLGDENNDRDDGLITELGDLERELEENKRERKEEHREVNSKVDQILDRLEDDDD